MKLIVAGTRTWRRTEKILEALYAIDVHLKITKIITGGSGDVDQTAVKWAEANGRIAEIHYADWSHYGKKAGPIRNNAMLLAGDRLLAFWDGKSRGTENMLNLAQANSMPHQVFNQAGEQVLIAGWPDAVQ